MNHNIPRTGVQGTPKKKAEPKYPKADWSEGSYHDMMMKAADAKREKYGTECTYNGYWYDCFNLHNNLFDNKRNFPIDFSREIK